MDFRPYFDALAERLRVELVGRVLEVTRQNRPGRACPRQPALVVLEAGVEPLRAGEDVGQPFAYRLEAALALHTQLDPDQAAPGDGLLQLVAGIEGALVWNADRGEPPSEDGHSTTLGGLVTWARFEGARFTDDEKLASQVTTLMTVTMEVAAA